jgi:superfamily II DNA/RNA helicase
MTTLKLLSSAIPTKVDELTNELAENQIKNDVLHGDLGQEKRNRILNKFRKGEFKVLVATDVAARGIDVPNVDLVCNYDISFDPEYYVHRIGRTGRAGKEGKAYSFVAGSRDKRLLRQIESFAKVKIEQYRLPSAGDLAKIEVEKVKKQIESIIAAGKSRYIWIWLLTSSRNKPIRFRWWQHYWYASFPRQTRLVEVFASATEL